MISTEICLSSKISVGLRSATKNFPKQQLLKLQETITDIKKDPYGNAILRILTHFQNKICFRCWKLRDGRIEFSLVPLKDPSLAIGSTSLKNLFGHLTKWASLTCFHNRSLNEVNIILDMLDAENPSIEEDSTN
mgnify:CR=1 FL=1